MVKGIAPPKEDDGRVFPFCDDLFYTQWKTAVTRAGLLEIDGKTGHMTIHIHCLRKYFRIRGEWVNPEFPEMLMGHIAGVRGIYARYDDAQLSDAYLKAELNLSVFEQSGRFLELRGEVEKQRVILDEKQAEIARKNSDFDELNRNAIAKTARLENQLSDLKQTFDAFAKYQMEETAKQIGDLQEHIRNLEYHLDRYAEEIDHVSGGYARARRMLLAKVALLFLVVSLRFIA